MPKEGYFAHFGINKRMQTLSDSMQTAYLLVNIDFKWAVSEYLMVCLSGYICFMWSITILDE